MGIIFVQEEDKIEQDESRAAIKKKIIKRLTLKSINLLKALGYHVKT
jgi:hypothetical protein